MDLEISPALSVPSGELEWRFSRSSGPGGQHVNTSDSRVELTWNIAESPTPTESQRERLLQKLSGRLVGGSLTVSSAEQRSQLRNRETARAKLAALLRTALAPDGPPRRPTKPTRGSQRRRLEAKGQRSDTKRGRRRPSASD
ncbi:alternative ribosome rescue aminoacyl-tRNA hydrolase ArfB [Mycetocola spongiae]|uniref:alternative ribosome rescue aminoacyl-tRNA hydrolase ArfB n=1 Tax=Mycetocola spongiae TaxID=2859226 RepID=UPI001CF0E0E7|nr:alternative ribosome rescue aminoacyl-tRNA hydrolase ArfB [Mycetocola spongiae]UCR89915.1 aminoacyl-tRNA hydrolase [Mycetocola spongiae]